MNLRVNPSFILRNYLLEEAIETAEKGDFSKVEEMLKKVLEPFGDVEKVKTTKQRPDYRFDICVSCSS